MNKSLLDKFIELNPRFNDDLNQLSDQSREKFLRKLRKEKQERNFLSTISEFRFCEFLEYEGMEYTYEPKIGGKTPDFLIQTKNERMIYFDVKRFNTSDFYYSNRKKLYEFCKKLKSIQKPYYIEVKHTSNKIETDIEEVFYKAKKWILGKNRKKDDFCILSPDIKIKIKKLDGIKDNVLYLISGNQPKIHINKAKSNILDKLKTYKNEIINKGLPFFVAIDLEFETLEPFDYWLQFLGGFETDISSDVESFRLGEFYQDKELDGLAGLLIRYNNEFYWLNNPINRINIYFKNVKLDFDYR